MDQALALISFGTSCALAGLAAWAVLSHSVRDGVVVKLGLIMLSMGHVIAVLHLAGSSGAADLLALNRARFVSNAGLLVVVLGYAWRHRRGERLREIVVRTAVQFPRLESHARMLKRCNIHTRFTRKR